MNVQIYEAESKEENTNHITNSQLFQLL